MTGDPIEKFNEHLVKANEIDHEFANACVLATAGKDGKPAARMVLIKQVNDTGFVFFTNLGSRKARELVANPNAALCFWWPQLQTQVRVEGTVKPVSTGEADEYFDTRPRGSQIGAWASRQSDVLPNHDILLRSVEEVKRRYEGADVPRPPNWSGFRLKADTIEFWYGREDRLHERYLYVRRGDRWETSMLYP
ncbi:MAG: pyridoxamine 5'-phosphate oxidase [Candidatus Latescibacterota bacterium]|nr:MAG: pyridoxamine 5'-phosphate oxidase [Candidatus Latescibacterota bacterium]